MSKATWGRLGVLRGESGPVSWRAKRLSTSGSSRREVKTKGSGRRNVADGKQTSTETRSGTATIYKHRERVVRLAWITSSENSA